MEIDELKGLLKTKLKHIANFIFEQEPKKKKKIVPDFGLDEGDLADLDIVGLETKKKKRKFLGYFTERDFEFVLKKKGIYERLEKMGFRNLFFVMNTEDPYTHRAALYYEKKGPKNLLGEMVCKIDYIKIKTPHCPDLNGKTVRTLYLEWLRLQNPKKKFTPERPRLPGQEYPGLGMGNEVFRMVVNMARYIQCEAIQNVPEYYHNAVIYSKEFLYLDPLYEGYILALQRDLKEKYHISQISEAFDKNCVYRVEDNQVFHWFTKKQLTPLTKELFEYFKSDNYVKIKRKVMAENHFYIDDECLKS